MSKKRPRPAALLDARHGDLQSRPGRRQDAEIEDAVLLGADQFLAVEQEQQLAGAVAQAKLRHAAVLRDLADLGDAATDRLIEPQPAGRWRRGVDQRQDGEIAKDLRGANRQARGQGEKFGRGHWISWEAWIRDMPPGDVRCGHTPALVALRSPEPPRAPKHTPG
jgi:hypothetical protein